MMNVNDIKKMNSKDETRTLKPSYQTIHDGTDSSFCNDITLPEKTLLQRQTLTTNTKQSS